MENRLLNPHELGMHSAACTPSKCVHGIQINFRNPRLLDTKEKVREANKKFHEFAPNKAKWRLGDHCWMIIL